MPKRIIKSPDKPERGGCEPQIADEPTEMPREAPEPIKLPDNAPIEAPAWPQPTKAPARL